MNKILLTLTGTLLLSGFASTAYATTAKELAAELVGKKYTVLGSTSDLWNGVATNGYTAEVSKGSSDTEIIFTNFLNRFNLPVTVNDDLSLTINGQSSFESTQSGYSNRAIIYKRIAYDYGIGDYYIYSNQFGYCRAESFDYSRAASFKSSTDSPNLEYGFTHMFTFSDPDYGFLIQYPSGGYNVFNGLNIFFYDTLDYATQTETDGSTKEYGIKLFWKPSSTDPKIIDFDVLNILDEGVTYKSAYNNDDPYSETMNPSGQIDLSTNTATLNWSYTGGGPRGYSFAFDQLYEVYNKSYGSYEYKGYTTSNWLLAGGNDYYWDYDYFTGPIKNGKLTSITGTVEAKDAAHHGNQNNHWVTDNGTTRTVSTIAMKFGECGIYNANDKDWIHKVNGLTLEKTTDLTHNHELQFVDYVVEPNGDLSIYLRVSDLKNIDFLNELKVYLVKGDFEGKNVNTLETDHETGIKGAICIDDYEVVPNDTKKARLKEASNDVMEFKARVPASAVASWNLTQKEPVTVFTKGVYTAESNLHPTFHNLRSSSSPTVTAVDMIEADENAPVEFYDLNGRKVENPQNGIFVRRQGSKVEKVVLK